MSKQNTKDVSKPFYKVAYGLFIGLAIYQILVRKDFIEAASSMGIAMIFDPFDQNITWNSRPKWQRIWLAVHLFLAAALLGYGISSST